MKTTPKCCFAKPVTLEWRLNRTKNIKNSVDALPQLCGMSPEETRSWLSKFVVEIRRQDEKPYPTSILKRILASIQLVYTKINFFKYPSFSLSRKVLDSRMKDHRSGKK